MSYMSMVAPSTRTQVIEALRFSDEWLRKNSLKEKIIENLVEAKMLYDMWGEMDVRDTMVEIVQSCLAESLANGNLNLITYQQL